MSRLFFNAFKLLTTKVKKPHKIGRSPIGGSDVSAKKRKLVSAKDCTFIDLKNLLTYPYKKARDTLLKKMKKPPQGELLKYAVLNFHCSLPLERFLPLIRMYSGSLFTLSAT